MAEKLSDLNLQTSYQKGDDDIAADFYLPCMERATRYDRAVGFFSSTVYIIAWPSLRGFVARNGAMRIICSPALSQDDIEAMSRGYSAREEAAVADAMRAELEKMLGSVYMAKATTVLASLIATGVLELRIAWMGAAADASVRRLFHDKLGVFTDGDADSVVFKGSMNETWPALSPDGNLESVDVFCSWSDGSDPDRVEKHRNYFERLWNNDYPGVTTAPFPEVVVKRLLDVAEVARWEEYVDEICLELDVAARWAADRTLGGRTPREHQVAALEAWEQQGRRGILEHATGSGKTYTALCAIRKALERGDVPVILVPSELLLEQWVSELRSTLGDLEPRILACGAGHSRWRAGPVLKTWTRPDALAGPGRHLVVATMDTAGTDRFEALLTQGSHLFIIADEVHRAGSAGRRRILRWDSGPRLGLSATPHRFGDREGTEAVLDYFGPIVQPPFTLADAIAAGALTPYVYSIHTVRLTDDEQHRWDEQTARIRQVYARLQQDGASGLADQLRLLLIRRSRIPKGAREKPDVAVRVLTAAFDPGQRWIVYCDSQVQLQAVRKALTDVGLPRVLEYHRGMMGDPAQTLAMFEQVGGIVVAIKCLDEGVDIPAVTHALILASSRNPREFVQRRGRVLRRANNKLLAHLHDTVVLPADDPSLCQDDADVAMLEGELARAIAFGESAVNYGATVELQRIAARFGLDWRELAGVGFEDDGDDDDD